MNYNQQHKFYCGVDLHARTMFTHVLDHKGKTVSEQDLPADLVLEQRRTGVSPTSIPPTTPA